MKKIYYLTVKELNTYFDSLIGYIVISAFLGFSGFFTWLYGMDIFLVGQASLKHFFDISYWTLFFFIPAITMRSFSEENKTGSLEMLLTKNITDWQVIVGKFMSCLIMIIIVLLLTVPYYITLSNIGNIDHSSTLLGYTGMIMMSAVYISVGIYISSLTNNQVIAFIVTIFTNIFFHIIFDILSNNFQGIIGEILYNMSMSTHFDSISRGIIDSRDVIWFFSLILIFLSLTKQRLNNIRL